MRFGIHSYHTFRQAINQATMTKAIVLTTPLTSMEQDRLIALGLVTAATTEDRQWLVSPNLDVQQLPAGIVAIPNSHALANGFELSRNGRIRYCRPSRHGLHRPKIEYDSAQAAHVRHGPAR